MPIVKSVVLEKQSLATQGFSSKQASRQEELSDPAKGLLREFIN